MKKLLTALVLSASLFLVACGPSYDLSSPEAFDSSVYEQAAKEGYSKQEAAVILVAYAESVAKADPEAAREEMSKYSSQEEFGRNFIGKKMQGKTFKKMQEIAGK